MSLQIYFSPYQEALADKLSQDLIEQVSTRSLFETTHIVVPNQQQKRWLQLYLSRKLGVLANVTFTLYDDFIAETLLKYYLATHTAEHDLMPESRRINMEMRVVILFRILSEVMNNPEHPLSQSLLRLQPALTALQKDVSEDEEILNKHLWHLSYHFINRFTSYEEQRLPLIFQWLEQQDYLQNTEKQKQVQEPLQRELYYLLYQKEQECFPAQICLNSTCIRFIRDLNAGLISGPPTPEPPVSFFGFSVLSDLQRETLFAISRHRSINYYQFNLCTEFWEDVTSPFQDRILHLHNPKRRAQHLDYDEWDPHENRLLKLFAIAGRENIRLLCDLVDRSSEENPIDYDLLVPGVPLGKTVLQQIHRQVFTRTQQPSPQPIPPDSSLTITACPTIHHEVEEIGRKIRHHLAAEPSLKLNDIAIYMTAPQDYVPAFEAAFQAPEMALPLNISEIPATSRSHLLHGIELLFKIAEESFERTYILDFLANRCVCERFGYSPAQLEGWLAWLEKLNIFNMADNAECPPHLSWFHAFKRLMLGEVMVHFQPPPSTRYSQANNHFRELAPFRDMLSSSPDEVAILIRLIESLHQTLSRWPNRRFTLQQWFRQLFAAFQTFFAPPTDLPKEQPLFEGVRQFLLCQLENVEGDDYHGEVPFIIFHEFVKTQLNHFTLGKGNFLSRGINLLPLSPHRALPFRVVFFAGMSQKYFPRPTHASLFDILRVTRKLGDPIRTDMDRLSFLEILLSTREAVHLSYVDRNLHKDQIIHPSSAIIHLRDYLQNAVTTTEYPVRTIPFTPKPDEILRPVNYPLSPFEHTRRVQTLLQSTPREWHDKLPSSVHAHKRECLQAIQIDTGKQQDSPEKQELHIRHLAAFVKNPLDAALSRHLSAYASDFTLRRLV
ncbi:MAG: hypothetical protein D6820_11965, partial [Lentisphaerae bacterium]